MYIIVGKKEGAMRNSILAAVLILLVSVSLSWANGGSLKKAYNLYYKGDKDAAIEMMEDYVRDNPDSGIYYFLGYAYYEKKDMEKAREYFTKSYKLKDFYSPIPEKNNQ